MNIHEQYAREIKAGRMATVLRAAGVSTYEAYDAIIKAYEHLERECYAAHRLARRNRRLFIRAALLAAMWLLVAIVGWLR